MVIAQPVQNRCLDSAETEIKALFVQIRSRECDKFRIAFSCKGINEGASGKAQTEHLRNLVVRLTRRIVKGFSQQIVVERLPHMDELSVSP